MFLFYGKDRREGEGDDFDHRLAYERIKVSSGRNRYIFWSTDAEVCVIGLKCHITPAESEFGTF